LDNFRSRLLEVFDGTYEGEIHTYLGCEITCDLEIGITTLSQKHYAEEILRTYGSWDVSPSSTVLPPGKRLEKGDTIILPDNIFHLSYRGIVGSLDYLVNMTRPDLAFAYSDLSKYVQCPQPAHMLALSTSSTTFVALTNWAYGITATLSTRTSSGVGLMQIERVILKLDVLTLATF
jgi:hypothetical protein